MITAVRRIIEQRIFPLQEKDSVEAYDLWAESYDTQPGNLMMDMDSAIFSQLLSEINIAGKQIADMGCGTGRHWPLLFRQKPADISGFDVSPGMLKQLQLKYPSAHVYQIKDNLFADIPDRSYDVIVSTLTVAHIEDIDEALHAWCRVLKTKGDIIITDFHPNALAFGGKRTFKHHNTSIAVKNFVHYISNVEDTLSRHGLTVVNKIEREVNESVKHYYEAKNALPVYEKFKDSRIIYGIHLRRGYDIE
ncbi:class I SAM-dependent methyltransferase [Mucilaginibacter calamicampi]|uniref:Class I SAM-dependent methyltransferase n=1 Tax=Mucilaginibacter calamicampi TaxID=1302352 RepID=A0ABW2YWM9_9SPHI